MTGSAADPAVIQLSDVEFAYPVAEGFRIRIDQMSVPAGDCIAIVGPSGSGKTTLLGLLAGILVPAHGKVVIDGEIQADFALNPEMLKKEFPFSKLVDKKVNVLIFPNLDSANITYKMMKELYDLLPPALSEHQVLWMQY